MLRSLPGWQRRPPTERPAPSRGFVARPGSLPNPGWDPGSAGLDGANTGGARHVPRPHHVCRWHPRGHRAVIVSTPAPALCAPLPCRRAQAGSWFSSSIFRFLRAPQAVIVGVCVCVCGRARGEGGWVGGVGVQSWVQVGGYSVDVFQPRLVASHVPFSKGRCHWHRDWAAARAGHPRWQPASELAQVQTPPGSILNLRTKRRADNSRGGGGPGPGPGTVTLPAI